MVTRNCSITGSNNITFGTGNSIEGDNNIVVGDNLQIKGSDWILIGNGENHLIKIHREKGYIWIGDRMMIEDDVLAKEFGKLLEAVLTRGE